MHPLAASSARRTCVRPPAQRRWPAYRLTVTLGGDQTPFRARPLDAVQAERSPRTAVVPDTSLAQRRASQSSACARACGRS